MMAAHLAFIVPDPAEARRRGAEVIRQLIVIGDGAKWICYPDVGIADLIPMPRLSRRLIWSRCAQCLIGQAWRDSFSCHGSVSLPSVRRS
jgi:hypothetical protein